MRDPVSRLAVQAPARTVRRGSELGECRTLNNTRWVSIHNQLHLQPRSTKTTSEKKVEKSTTVGLSRSASAVNLTNFEQEPIRVSVCPGTKLGATRDAVCTSSRCHVLCVCVSFAVVVVTKKASRIPPEGSLAKPTTAFVSLAKVPGTGTKRFMTMVSGEETKHSRFYFVRSVNAFKG